MPRHSLAQPAHPSAVDAAAGEARRLTSPGGGLRAPSGGCLEACRALLSLLGARRQHVSAARAEVRVPPT